jgi:hypothetical protein
MNLNLNAEVLKTLEAGRKIGEAFVHYSFPEGPNADRAVVISNKRTGKAGMLLQKMLTGNIKYYLICFSKWNWAETEGFTSSEIVTKLGNQVFKQVKETQLPYMLACEGDP